MLQKRHPFLFTAVLSCTVFIIVVISIFAYYQKLQEKEYKLQQDELTKISEQIALQVDTTINNYYTTLYATAELLNNQPFITREKLEQLGRISAREGFFRLGLINTEGILRIHGDKNVDISDRPYFKRLLQGEDILTGVRDSRLNNNKMFLLAVPVRRADGVIIGGLHCSFLLEDFSLHTNSLNFGSYHIHIIDRNGVMIVPSSNHDISSIGTAVFEYMNQSPTGLPLEEFKEKIKNGQPVLTEILGMKTIPMLAYAYPLAHNNWICFVTLPASQVQEQLNLLLDRDFYFLLISILGAIGGLTFFIISQLRTTAMAEKDLRKGLLGNILGFIEADIDADRILSTSDNELFQQSQQMTFSEAIKHMIELRVHEDFQDHVSNTLSRKHIHQMYNDITHSYTADFMGLTSENEMIWMECKINIKKDPATAHLIIYCILRDINEKKKNEISLYKRAERDTLTGLYNRAAGTELIDNYLKSNCHEKDNSHAFIIIDLDNFKNVNDKLGHLMGDKALKDTAQIFTENFRQDDIICRLGGDEFIILMKNITLDMVEKKLRNVLNALHLTYSIGNTSVAISGSAGFALAPSDGKLFKQLYPKADSALYIAKDAGKGISVQYPNQA